MSYKTFKTAKEWFQLLQRKQRLNDGIRFLWPQLYTTQIYCPDTSCASPNEHSLSATLAHLNDYHKWSREQIADWLDTLNIDLEART